MASQEVGCSSDFVSKELDGYSGHKISDVWKYFTKTTDKKRAICSICQKDLAYSGETTNLCEHLSQNIRINIFLLAKQLKHLVLWMGTFSNLNVAKLARRA